ncbi:solute carrier family 45 member 3-like [Gigantopelta aegis]|uniref:solute carrier family 45 member 3-like n=1 Tax=Gigantopelta aegis TaxID=1735272 RepID=UPI001B88E09F|nr:solute carrier family 45 member 3-like [Gigantopelta aegis]
MRCCYFTAGDDHGDLGTWPYHMSCIPKRSSVPLSIVQILLLNTVVCGVEICACAGFTYIPPMLLKVGYSEENMSLILGIGPLMGFVLNPIIGRASDQCRSFYGRRRPFIFGLSAMLVVSLYMIPFGEYFMSLIFGRNLFSKMLGVWSLTAGSVLLDFTSQACLTPCEALLSDVTKDSGQYERAFTTYSLMISLGGVLGYLLTAIDWNSNPVGVYFGSQESSIFSLLIVIFTLMLASTLMVASEKPISSSPSSEYLQNHVAAIKSNLVSIQTAESGYSSSSSEDIPASILARETASSHIETSQFHRPTQTLRMMRTKVKLLFSGRIMSGICGLLRFLSFSVFRLLPSQVKEMLNVPVVLRKLCFANFCSWTAVMGFNLYFSDFVAQAVYMGSPNAPDGSASGRLYDEGVRMGSWGLLFHCITSASYSFFVEKMVDRYDCRATYIFGMISFVVAMSGMVVFRNAVFVSLMAAATGFAYATLTTIPFILISRYHTHKELYFFDVSTSTGTNMSATAERGIGTDMGILDSAYFLSQVILTAIMGYIVHLTGTVLTYMVSAGAMGILACFFIQDIVCHTQKFLSGRNTIWRRLKISWKLILLIMDLE